MLPQRRVQSSHELPIIYDFGVAVDVSEGTKRSARRGLIVTLPALVFFCTDQSTQNLTIFEVTLQKNTVYWLFLVTQISFLVTHLFNFLLDWHETRHKIYETFNKSFDRRSEHLDEREKEERARPLPTAEVKQAQAKEESFRLSNEYENLDELKKIDQEKGRYVLDRSAVTAAIKIDYFYLKIYAFVFILGLPSVLSLVSMVMAYFYFK